MSSLRHHLPRKTLTKFPTMKTLHSQAKQLDVDPRACIGSFFERIQVADVEYKKHFDVEVESFKERIKKRALEKIEEALAEQEVRENNEFPPKFVFIQLSCDWFYRKRSVRNV